jgi:periplasmic protein TonB
MATDVPAPQTFAAFQRVAGEVGLVRRRRSVTVGVSLAAHSLLLAVAATGISHQIPRVSPPETPRVVVSLGRPAARRPAPPPEAPKPPPPRKAPRPVMALVQPTQPTQAHIAQELTPPEAAAADETDDAGVDDGEPGPVGSPDGVATAQVAPPPQRPAPPPPPAMTADQRRQQLARYLQDALRPRFDSRFSYPAEAERMGVEGRVTLRLTIDCSGRLLAAAASGCPSDILCEHAQRTIRDASPFPPPPRELGSTIQVEMPIAYRLD